MQVAVHRAVDDPVQAGRGLHRRQHRQDRQRRAVGERRRHQRRQRGDVSGIVDHLHHLIGRRHLQLHRVGQVEIDRRVARRHPVREVAAPAVQVLAQVAHRGAQRAGPTGAEDAVAAPREHAAGVGGGDVGDHHLDLVAHDVLPLADRELERRAGAAALVDQQRAHRRGVSHAGAEPAGRALDHAGQPRLLGPELAQHLAVGLGHRGVARHRGVAGEPRDPRAHVRQLGREDRRPITGRGDDRLQVRALEGQEGAGPRATRHGGGAGVGLVGRRGELGVDRLGARAGPGRVAGVGAEHVAGERRHVEHRHARAMHRRAAPDRRVGIGHRRREAPNEVVAGLAPRDVDDVLGERVVGAVGDHSHDRHRHLAGHGERPPPLVDRVGDLAADHALGQALALRVLAQHRPTVGVEVALAALEVRARGVPPRGGAALARHRHEVLVELEHFPPVVDRLHQVGDPLERRVALIVLQPHEERTGGVRAGDLRRQRDHRAWPRRRVGAAGGGERHERIRLGRWGRRRRRRAGGGRDHVERHHPAGEQGVEARLVLEVAREVDVAGRARRRGRVRRAAPHQRMQRGPVDADVDAGRRHQRCAEAERAQALAGPREHREVGGADDDDASGAMLTDLVEDRDELPRGIGEAGRAQHQWFAVPTGRETTDHQVAIDRHPGRPAPQELGGGSVGLDLGTVGGRPDAQRGFIAVVALCRRVHQLVRQHVVAVVVRQAGAQVDVTAIREGRGIDRGGGGVRRCVVVDADAIERHPEQRLEPVTHGRRQWRAAARTGQRRRRSVRGRGTCRTGERAPCAQRHLERRRGRGGRDGRRGSGGGRGVFRHGRLRSAPSGSIDDRHGTS